MLDETQMSTHGHHVGLHLGLVDQPRALPGISADAQRCPNLTNVITSWVRGQLPGLPFLHVAVWLNRNSELVIDTKSVGMTHVATLGRFSGGAIYVHGAVTLVCCAQASL